MDALTFDVVFKALAVLIVAWKGYEEVKKMVQAITARHDREKGWDEATKKLQEERVKILEQYDKQFKELEVKIDANHADTEAKVMELRTEILMLTKCMSAVLDGLKQLNCNGVVTETKKSLDDFLMSKAYDL